MNTNSIMTTEYGNELFTLERKSDRTKEENRRLETLKHYRAMNGAVVALASLEKNMKDDDGNNIVTILEYPNVSGLYRIQVRINGKMKTVARIKIGKKDVYVLVRESTAKALKKKYEIINYNLPAGYYVDFTKAYKEFTKVVEYHFKHQTA